jgi:Skp family chaperone for outer membrane proteins
MKKFPFVFVMMLSLTTGLAAFAADEPAAGKIGTVDMQKALQSVEDGKKAKAELEKSFNAKKKELQTEEASIKKMGEEFRKQSLVMNEEARAKKQGEIQERIMKFQELTQRADSDSAHRDPSERRDQQHRQAKGLHRDSREEREQRSVLARSRRPDQGSHRHFQ